jgi:hypothetical protein
MELEYTLTKKFIKKDEKKSFLSQSDSMVAFSGYHYPKYLINGTKVPDRSDFPCYFSDRTIRQGIKRIIQMRKKNINKTISKEIKNNIRFKYIKLVKEDE